ncbi:SMC-Scp complex subunit ScpB [Brumicola pallidula]|jgi:segregation and condensation protein B|uniref:Segregation and condensation protein B n=1 Tax=Brumicola pallidula DSM 14239 = ACAM 615 TaxID=1121922 RepID=K6ZEA9_9ALTE|nr:SMC-Scp complex subunit ScpB [Glaciecola pallidula]GAC28682.1 segregation and condensation protein B [Glaciecola pallidula DSM 14239 = ACAM 615]
MQKLNEIQLKQLIEAGIFVADGALSIDLMKVTFLADFSVSTAQIKKALAELELDYAPRGIHLVKVASGYRFQSDEGLGILLSKLWQENAPRYSRAMMETLALIAYRQPITRGEIEAVRGVSVSSHIVKSLLERNWVKVIGHKEVPGRPALLATTKTFLDYFSLSTLAELPSADNFVDSLEQAMAASNIEDNTLDNEKLH